MSAAILRSAACISDVITWPACVAGVSNNTQAKPFQLFIGKRPKQYMYRWRELPRVSFCRDKHVSRPIFVNTSLVATKLCKYHFVATNMYHDKYLSTRLLSRQNYACIILLRQTCITTNICQHVFCRDKIMQVSFCRDKHVSRQIFVNTSFVETKLCKYHFCRDNGFAATNILLSRRRFVATSILLSRQTDCMCLEEYNRLHQTLVRAWNIMTLAH